MWLAGLFIIIAIILDVIAFKSKGNFASLVIIVLAFGCSVIALPFIGYNNPTVTSQVNITTPSGNILIPSYNQTYSPSPTTLGFSLQLGYGIVLIEFVLAVLTVGYLFFESGKKKKEKYNN